MEELLQLGAHAHDFAACGGASAGTAAHDIDHIAVVQADDNVRGRSPARGRGLPPQVAARPPLWAAIGEPFCVLSTLCRRTRWEGSGVLVGVPKGAKDPQ